MSDYISREAFLEKERRLYCQDCSRRKNSNGKLVYEIGDAPCRACGIGDVLDDFEDIPAADVRPVVRGKWEPDYDYAEYDFDGSTPLIEPRKFQDGWKCSSCGGYTPSETSFCPNCGADMRPEPPEELIGTDMGGGIRRDEAGSVIDWGITGPLGEVGKAEEE